MSCSVFPFSFADETFSSLSLTLSFSLSISLSVYIYTWFVINFNDFSNGIYNLKEKFSIRLSSAE